MYSHIQMWFHNFLFFVPAIFTETQKIQFPLHKPIFMTRTDINKTCFERAPGKCLCSVAWSCADTDRRAICPLGKSHAVVRAAEHSSFNRTGPASPCTFVLFLFCLTNRCEHNRFLRRDVPGCDWGQSNCPVAAFPVLCPCLSRMPPGTVTGRISALGNDLK